MDLLNNDLSFEDLGIDLSSEEFEHVEERKYSFQPITFRGQNGTYEEVIYVTDDISIASIFNQSLDADTHAEVFILPEGLPVKRMEYIDKFYVDYPVELTYQQIQDTYIQAFNNQYLRAMLTN